MGDESNRLDSWKAIAEYLGRDVSTARRWEKTAGLPVRRLPGTNGRSVFAYRDEIDAWRNGTPASALELPSVITEPSSSTVITSPVPDAATVPPPGAPAAARSSWRALTVVALTAVVLVVIVLASIAWRARTSLADAGTTLQVRTDGIVATGGDGTERWRYPFPPGQQAWMIPEYAGHHNPIVTSEGPALLASISGRFVDGRASSGQIFWFSPGGSLRRTFAFDDRLTFGGAVYGEPWNLTDVQIEEGPIARRFAVAAHHYHWWPSMVTVLDGSWRRRGTFVNAGWIERVHWLSANRLLVAGFSNDRDGGLLALLDPDALDGQSPVAADSAFRCTSCGGGGPIRYIVMPRSEVNRVSGSRFNRAVVDVLPDRLVVRTIEVPMENSAADALYEFSPSLDLLRATYSDRYWDQHAELEHSGKLSHSRADCPDRDGPPAIEIWDQAHGWTIHKIHAVQ
jgi:hypothetical protein